MQINRSTRLRLRLAGTSFVILFFVVAALLLSVSRDYNLQFDWTYAGRNSLSEGTRTLLERLDQPIRITAFASEREGVRKGIGELIARYQQVKKDIAVEYVDPDRDPARVREAGVQFDGEMIVEYGEGRDTLRQASEEGLSNLLARLGRGGERWLVFLSGHGERSPDKQANHDYSSFAEQLRKRGFKTRVLNLAETGQIPENTAALVVAGARSRYFAGELKTLDAYVKKGGNLFWLADPGTLQGLEALAEALGVEFLRGSVVDPVSQALTGAPANFIVVSKYPMHPAVQNLNMGTLFPDASALRYQAPKDWHAVPLLETTASAWVERNMGSGKVQFDKDQDIKGPATLGVALTRKTEGREQRVAVLGDGDFLANGFLGNGGNLDLGMNLMNWVTSEDSYINIPARSAPDAALSLSRTAQLVIGGGFLLVLPLGLVVAGVTIWWRRRRR